MAWFIQVFILIDVLLIGLLAPVVWRHARAHFKPDKHAHPEGPDGPAAELPEAVKARLLKASEDDFKRTVTEAVGQLQNNLSVTTADINNLIKKLATEVVNEELQQYRQDLTKIHAEATKDLSGFKTTMESHEAEFKNQLAADMKLEKDKLVKQIDTRLGDAVTSFLLETLGHNVDLGSQSAYLMSILEEHKAEFIKEVDDEKPAT